MSDNDGKHGTRVTQRTETPNQDGSTHVEVVIDKGDKGHDVREFTRSADGLRTTMDSSTVFTGPTSGEDAVRHTRGK